jgi:hypothetical protein
MKVVCLELRTFQRANQFAYIFAIMMPKLRKFNIVPIINEN